MARLQQVAVAYKELDRRSKERRPKAKIAIGGLPNFVLGGVIIEVDTSAC